MLILYLNINKMRDVTVQPEMLVFYSVCCIFRNVSTAWLNRHNSWQEERHKQCTTWTDALHFAIFI